MITQQYLKSILDYNPETGVFTWINCSKPHLNGKEAGCKNKSGYILIKLDGKKYYAHRLAFLIIEGKFPENNIDHIDGDKENNKRKNLRECSVSENAYNAKLRKDNTSGCKCVSFHSIHKKWEVSITINKKKKHHGFFDSKEEAEVVAVKVMKESRGEFFRLA